MFNLPSSNPIREVALPYLGIEDGKGTVVDYSRNGFPWSLC